MMASIRPAMKATLRKSWRRYCTSSFASSMERFASAARVLLSGAGRLERVGAGFAGDPSGRTTPGTTTVSPEGKGLSAWATPPALGPGLAAVR